MVDFAGVKQAVREALSNTIGNWSSVQTGQDTVGSAGTPEALNGGNSLLILVGASLSVTALPTNDGNVYIGDETVTSDTGDILTPDTSIAINITDVSNLYIDVDNNGEGVSWIVESDS